MYTRVSTIHFLPENLAEVIRINRDLVVPDARQQKGFNSLLLLTNEAAGVGISCASFETIEDIQASEASGYYQRQVDKFARVLTGTPDKQVYEAGVYELKGGEARAARFLPMQLQPGKIDEAQIIDQDSILPAANQQQGFQGVLFLTDKATNRGISISLWKTDDDLRAGEASGFYQEQVAKLAPFLVAEPVREVCAVSVLATAGERAVASIDTKALIHRYFEECWTQGNLALLDQLVDANVVSHDVNNPGCDGIEGQKRLITTYRTAFPDMIFDIESLMAEGDTVACRWIAQGTNQGVLQGVPPTGKRATVPGLSIIRTAGGKIIESWTSWDRLDALQQLGIAPTPEAPLFTMQQPGMEQPTIH
jgi:steroid delta-isomerase-like uncharacterized protein